MTDSAAFIVGSLCGKTKIAPELSPNKTLEGGRRRTGGHRYFVPAGLLWLLALRFALR